MYKFRNGDLVISVILEPHFADHRDRGELHLIVEDCRGRLRKEKILRRNLTNEALELCEIASAYQEALLKVLNRLPAAQPKPVNRWT